MGTEKSNKNHVLIPDETILRNEAMWNISITTQWGEKASRVHPVREPRSLCEKLYPFLPTTLGPRSPSNIAWETTGVNHFAAEGGKPIEEKSARESAPRWKRGVKVIESTPEGIASETELYQLRGTFISRSLLVNQI